MWNKIQRIYIGEDLVRPSLPSEYQRVEYIQSTWAQYIDTWFSPNGTYLKTEIKFRFNSFSTSKGDTPFIYGYTASNFCFLCRNGGSWRFEYWNGNSASVTGVSVSTWTDYTISIEANNWTQTIDINGTTSTASCWSSLTTWSIPLFCRYWGKYGGSWNEFGYFSQDLRLYYFKIYNGTFLARDFVPCYRKSDNVIWMYDLVGRQFYINAGSWSFTKWPNA